MSTVSSDRRMAQALRWMIETFSAVSTPYQLVGGCAAHAYGATRPVHDIDVYVPGRHLPAVATALDEYVTHPPEWYQDERWKLIYLKACYAGWRIEVADAESTMYYDVQARTWRPAAIDFDAAETRTLFGVDVSVMPKTDLITYKRRLDRPVDRADLHQMQA